MTIDPSTTKNLLNPGELAELLHVSMTSVYRLVENGKIPHYKVGGSLRFGMKDISAYLERNRVESID